MNLHRPTTPHPVFDPARLALVRSAGEKAVPPLRPRVDIPVRDPCPDAEDRARHHSRGRFLARQEAWDQLAKEMREAESAKLLTPGLAPVTMCLAEGARSDVCTAARKAVARGEPQRVVTTLRAFEASLADEDPEDLPLLYYILAMAHVETAGAWRGASPAAKLAQQRRSAYVQHMRAAQALADRFDPFEHNTILWAALRCAVLEADANPASRMADDYEDFIEMDPRLPASMRALGRNARPRRFGSWEVLENEARRVAMQTADVWGVGGYTWVYIGALERDAGAFRRLDAELFIAGLHDVLARFPTQDMANRLAAFTGLTVGGPSEPGSSRRRVADALGWITQDHLRELHPVIWAEAPTPGRPLPGDSTQDPSKRGRIRANSALGEFYAPALNAGRRLVFSADGVRMLKGD
ncbi:hypothetical protein J4E08_11110 [Sagittula sp. NFXS13]|uniref:hypothetical protein n=1 Tax=Sagittula sp. NFXS13 TaxID=2819095 RepID=UPI0032DFC0F1